MANYNPGNASASTGWSTTKPSATEVSYTVQFQLPVASHYDISINETRPGWLTGRRPFTGQQFPRGIYNK